MRALAGGKTKAMRVPSVSAWLPLLRATWAAYQRHNSQWLAAALAYFAAFAVAPLIIVVVAIAGAFLHGHQSAINEIYTRLPGPETVAVRQIVSGTLGLPRHGLIAQIAGWAFFVIAALGLFGSLQFALNTTWDVTPQKMGIWQTVRRRAVSFALMLTVAALLLLSVIADSALTAVLAYLPHAFGGQATLVKGADSALSLAIVWLLFAVLFEFLPDARIAWRDVWIGAGITAALFVAGQFLLGFYLGRAGISSAYGAFGSLVVFLLWANYSAQIVLFGAEFTHVYATQRETL
jgi:membrane protein